MTGRLVVIALVLALGAPARAAEPALAAYREALGRFSRALRPAEPLDPTVEQSLTLDVLDKAQRFLEGRRVRLRRHASETEASLEILPDGETGLGRLARHVAGMGGALVAYDLKFFARTFDRPAASFSRERNTLLVPHAAVLSTSPVEPSVFHELVHLRTWRDLKAGKPSPYYGHLEGEAFRPDYLDLDEMNAYAHDVRGAARRLRGPADRAAETELSPRRLGRILSDRRDGLAPAIAGPVEEAWSLLVSKICYASQYVAGASRALGALAPLPVASYERDSVSTLARIGFGGTSSALLNLVSSHGPADPRNPELLQSQLTWLRDVVRQHERLLGVQWLALEAVSAESEPGRARARLEALAALGLRPRQPALTEPELRDRYRRRMKALTGEALPLPPGPLPAGPLCHESSG